jgi:beta-N-acetylhexosaminidase
MITCRIPTRSSAHSLTWFWTMRIDAELGQASTLLYDLHILVCSLVPHHLLKGWKVVLLLLFIIIIVLPGNQDPQFTHNGFRTLISTSSQLDLFTKPLLSKTQTSVSKPSPDSPQIQELARFYLAHMSLDEELGQLLMVQYDTMPDLQNMISQQHIGGVIMYQKNISTAQQTKQDIAQMQQGANFPLFIAIDQEGGKVNRLSHIYGSSLSAKQMRLSGNPNLAFHEGKRTGQRMLDLGINMNLAPDVDIAVKDGYIDWDHRGFGDNPHDVIKYAGSYLEGLQQTGIIACLKHFVGLGAIPRGTSNDPHQVLPTTSASKEQIFNTDLVPFKHFIQSNNPLDHPGFVMPTDLLVPSIDPTYPTEFSHIFLTDILRKQLGFDGVILSDSLHMGGVKVNSQHLSIADAAVLALQAGNDMALGVKGSAEVTQVITGLKAALQNGMVTKERIDDAVTHILTLKMERHLMPTTPQIGRG